jgi:hypothetical protein
MSLGLGIDMSAEDAVAFLTGDMYPLSEFTDSIGEGIDADTAFVVCAGCCACGLMGATYVALKEHSKETRVDLVITVIHGMAEMYKSENQTPLTVQELRSRILKVCSKSWRAGMEHNVGGNASPDYVAQTACLMANHGQPNREKETALYVLISRKYESALGTLKLLKKNRVI